MLKQAAVTKSTSNSITELIIRLKNDDSYAAHQIWQRYVLKLTMFAKLKLDSFRSRVEDEHDAVHMAYAKFLQLVTADRLKKLDNRDDLWQILSMLTERRVKDIFRRENAKKRGRTQLVDVPTINADNNGLDIGVTNCPAQETDSLYYIEFWEELEECLNVLNDDRLIEITLSKLQAQSNEVIANKLGISVSTVNRKLRKIERIWQRRNE